MNASRKKWALPLLVLLVSVLAGFALLATGPPVETKPADTRGVVVRVIEIEPTSVQLQVRSQGSVVPRTESELIPEVSGRVVWVSPALVSGGFFEAGDALLRIDPSDHESTLARARASRARARGEHEHAVANLRRRRELASRNVASDSLLNDAEREERVSSAALQEAEVDVVEAERNLSRTELRAPFTGRVREKHADVGQFLNRGSSAATLYATDYVEVRLPLPDADLAFLDLPLGGGTGEGPPVVLRARFAGRDHSWQGRIVRTEGEIDSRSRMVHVVARVEDPYVTTEGDRPPLAVGLFVEAEISGRTAEEVLVIPRAALRNDRQVLVVDAEDRIHLRQAEVLRVDREDVFVRMPLGPGERICVTPLQAVVENMKVRPVATQDAAS